MSGFLDVGWLHHFLLWDDREKDAEVLRMLKRLASSSPQGFHSEDDVIFIRDTADSCFFKGFASEDNLMYVVFRVRGNGGGSKDVLVEVRHVINGLMGKLTKNDKNQLTTYS